MYTFNFTYMYLNVDTFTLKTIFFVEMTLADKRTSKAGFRKKILPHCVLALNRTIDLFMCP